MCLSYYHLKKYDILDLEISKSKEPCIQLIRLLVSYTRNEADRNSVLNDIESMIQDKRIDSKDDLSRLVISSIFMKEKNYSDALKALHQLSTLPALLAQINILIIMKRVDLAERQLKLMQNKDDYATLTLLAAAQVRLAGDSPREAQDIARELEDKYRATPLLKNIQAAAAILQGDFDGAKEHSESSLDLDNDNLEALINMGLVLSGMRASQDVKERNFDRLRTLYPKHEFVEDINRIDTLELSM